MKRIIIISLIIAAFSSIIFFVVAFLLNNEFVALKKTLIAFPAFIILYITIFIVLDVFFPVRKKKDNKKEFMNIDYTFKDIE